MNKMGKSMDIARKVIDDEVVKGGSFSYDEIQNKILSNKGIFRINPGYTVGEYLTDLEERGIIAFNHYTKKFISLFKELLKTEYEVSLN